MTATAPVRETTSHAGGIRPDIQGLRALAVAAVLAFHLWPGAVTGGYVGVDVFLVISGYLITAHLLREPPTTWRAVGRFWGRRVRRLLPASALVIVVTVLLGAALLPSTQLERTGGAAVTSALYVQNWSLARAATDYLAAENAPTALQHYWSLSVEEQFYAGWPLLLGVAALVGTWWARRRARVPGEGSTGASGAPTGAPTGAVPVTVPVTVPGAPTRVAVAVVVLGVLAASLGWSAHLTAIDPAAAYFVTTTRVWELALGGAVALAGLVRPTRPLLPGRTAAVAAVLGLAAILVAVLTFSSDTPFPGTAALLPTLGTALVIAAQASPRSVTGRLLGPRPVQLLGDVSYSTYLWHWPLIVLVPFAVHRELRWWELTGIALGSVALAWVTKRWVEDPVRRSPLLNRSALGTTAVLVGCTAAGVAAGMALQTWAADRSAREIAAAEQAQAAHPECLGAAALLSGADCSAFAGQLWTTPVQAAADKPRLYADGCWNEQPYQSRTTCSYGPDDGMRVALVGNSHAGHWFPPLEALAAERGWRITTYLASACYPVDVDVLFDDPAAGEGCAAWNGWVRQQVTSGGYDLVVMSTRTDQHLADVPRDREDDVAQESYARELDAFTTTGAAVLVIRDTPNFPASVPDCVSASPSQDCTTPRDEGLEVDPLARAAAADDSGLVELLDVSDLLCDAQVCHGVIGDAIVMFDHGHLTATFARTLRPVIDPAVDAALARAGTGSTSAPASEVAFVRAGGCSPIPD